MDFARAADQQPLIESQTASFEAVTAVAGALKAAGDRRRKTLPVDPGVLDTLNRLGEVFEKGVEKIEWIVPRQNGTKQLTAEYVPAVRAKIAARVQKPAAHVPSTVEGTLELGEGKVCITTAVGVPSMYGYELDRVPEVIEAMHKPVKAKVDPKTRKIEKIEIQEEPGISGVSFFAPKTIDQLIAEQGIRPIADLAVLSGALPDDDLDDLVAEIYRSRER